MVISNVRRPPPRGPLENGAPWGFHMWDSLENQTHGMFILIAFSRFSAAEIGNLFFSFICFFDGLLGSLENQCDWCEIFIGCPEY